VPIKDVLKRKRKVVTFLPGHTGHSGAVGLARGTSNFKTKKMVKEKKGEKLF